MASRRTRSQFYAAVTAAADDADDVAASDPLPFQCCCENCPHVGSAFDTPDLQQLDVVNHAVRSVNIGTSGTDGSGSSYDTGTGSGHINDYVGSCSCSCSTQSHGSYTSHGHSRGSRLAEIRSMAYRCYRNLEDLMLLALLLLEEDTFPLGNEESSQPVTYETTVQVNGSSSSGYYDDHDTATSWSFPYETDEEDVLVTPSASACTNPSPHDAFVAQSCSGSPWPAMVSCLLMLFVVVLGCLLSGP